MKADQIISECLDGSRGERFSALSAAYYAVDDKDLFVHALMLRLLMERRSSSTHSEARP